MSEKENIVGAILFDTRSIQRYIFSGTKLKTNIGASYIVGHVFQDVLVEKILKTAFGDQLDCDGWEKAGKEIVSLPKACYVAYIGGGKALVLFKETDGEVLKKYVKSFTRELLTQYPGLHTGAAIGTIDLTHFQDTLSILYDTLKNYQNSIFPMVNVPYTGLTLSCEVNGETANYWDAHGVVAGTGRKEDARFYSQEVGMKAQKDEEADRALQTQFQQVIKDYTFPQKLEELGQLEGENDIAIVHIDGNNMGVKYQTYATELYLQSAMSYAIQKKTESAFAKLLHSITREMDLEKYKDEKNGKELLDIEGLKDRNQLPIRPLILGGDDVTFICPARVALQYAVRFIQFMGMDIHGPESDPEDKEIKKYSRPIGEICGDTGSIHCCGGIAILPTSYPFFRGYELAEQLCGKAKAKSRKDDSCWIDFAILHGEQAPTLDQIRRQEYRGALGTLHFGPYRIALEGETAGAKDITWLMACIEAFRNGTPENPGGWPSNKIKELRFVLQHGAHEINTFMEQMNHVGKSLPDIKAWAAYAKWTGVDGKKTVTEHPLFEKIGGTDTMVTPYVDAIEMIDYVIPGLEDEHEDND